MKTETNDSLSLAPEVTAPGECCVIKITPGNKGDLIGRRRDGKVVILQGGYEKSWVEGWAFVCIADEREKVCFGYSVMIYGKESKHALRNQPSLNFAAPTAVEFMAKVNAAALEGLAAQTLERETEMAARKAAAEAKAAKEAAEDAEALEVEGSAGLGLLSALRSHDWYHSFSDCGATWREGNAQWEGIKERMAKMVNRDAAVKWFRIYAPSGTSLP